jgi:tetratricopeptide (TPR) repeat protein
MAEAGGGPQAIRAFVSAIGLFGAQLVADHVDGSGIAIDGLIAEEENLIAAWRLARRHGCWDAVHDVLAGLQKLYWETGRRSELGALVEEAIVDVIDPITDQPLPLREDAWDLLTQARIQLAREKRNFGEAARLQMVATDRYRETAEPALALLPSEWSIEQRSAVNRLFHFLHELAQIQRVQNEADCVDNYLEVMKLARMAGSQRMEAVSAFNLSSAYLHIPAIHDVTEAENWCRRSLELRDQRDNAGRARCLSLLGTITANRFSEAVAAGGPKSETQRLRHSAEASYRLALSLFPESDVLNRAITNRELGAMWVHTGDVSRALRYFRESIRQYDDAGEIRSAGEIRFNVAITLKNAGRFGDALAYAEAALRSFEAVGDESSSIARDSQRLIGSIREMIR